MAEEQLSADEALKKATWGYIGVGVLWLSLILSGIALERLSLSDGFLTGLLPGEVNTLRAENAELDKQVRELKDANRRLDGLIGREAATAEALVYCQAENREIAAEIKELKASAAAPAEEPAG